MPALTALQTFDLRIPGCRSLKEKRHVIKTLVNGLRSKFNVSVAEVDHQDLWQRSSISVAAAAGEHHHARRVMHEVQRFVERWAEVEVIGSELTIHGQED